MSSSATDKSTRKEAITFRGQWFSNLNYGGTCVILEDGQADGDLRPFSLGSSALVRIAKPTKGQLIEARLTARFKVPNTTGTQLSIYVGKFQSDGVTAATISDAEIARMHEILTGESTPFTYTSGEEVFIDGLNLMPLIPKEGSTDFNEDAFIVGLKLSLAGSSAQWYLRDFKVDCSALLAEVRK